MPKIITGFVMLMCIFFISGCSENKSCSSICANIPADESLPSLTQQQIDEGGCYYGFLDQKRSGTPDKWIHGGGDSKSAVWCPLSSTLNPEFEEKCDCKEY